MADEYTVPLTAWAVVILSEFIDLLAVALMKKSGRFTNIRYTCMAYLLDITTTTLNVWSLSELDYFSVSMGTGIVEDVGTVLISVFFFHESVTISKIVAMGLITVGVMLLALSDEDEDENDRCAPWPSSWDEPLWGTGKPYVPGVLDVSDSESDGDL